MSDTIRVRFAPSPTGSLHIGGARTALYNWLFAKSRSGKFILRIEDTDVARSTREAINEIIDGMKWLDLHWDEGPDKGGECGPYRQTERISIYSKHIDELLNKGMAYRCYCPPEELKREREAARKKGLPVMYSKKCRDLPGSRLKEFEREKVPYSVRFAVPLSGVTGFEDMVRGRVEFPNESINDFIIVRQNGVPTYNLAVSVDDTEMRITHVIRGEDHTSNTPKQIMLIKELGGDLPVYGHLPLIIGPDRQPLSKRHGATSVEEFRTGGYLPEALINYLALLGWSYDDKTTFFTVDELKSKFSLERISKSPAMIDFQKLEWMNGHYIRNKDAGELTEDLTEYLKYRGVYQFYAGSGKPSLKDVVGISQDKMKTLANFAKLNDFLFQKREITDETLEIMNGIPEAKNILQDAAGILAGLKDFSREEIEEGLKAEMGRKGYKPKPFFQAIRVAISGKRITAGLFESLELLGKEKSVTYISEITNLLK